RCSPVLLPPSLISFTSTPTPALYPLSLHDALPISDSPYRADWDVAAEKWNTLGEIARREGIKLYTHNHDAAYGFLLDGGPLDDRSEEHTSELQSRENLVCRLLLEKKKRHKRKN